MKTQVKIVALVAMSLALQSARAATEGTNELIVHRMTKPLVVGVGLNNAGPAGGGLRVGYSLLSWLRAEGGYSQMEVTTGVSVDMNKGEVSTTTAKYEGYSLGAKFFMPNWNFTPVAGLHIARYSVKSEEGEAMFNGMTGTGAQLYSTIGLDWQTQSGFSTELGLNVGIGGEMQAAAFIDVGWAWDIL